MTGEGTYVSNSELMSPAMHGVDGEPKDTKVDEQVLIDSDTIVATV